MRTVTLSQFLDEDYNFDYGIDPIPNKFYQVIDYHSSYEVEYEDDDGEYNSYEIDAIKIFSVYGRRNYIVHGEDEINYNKLTIILDDDSELFDHRR